jgi:hypothetical protein
MSDNTLKYGPLIDFIRGIYGTDGVVPLHEPRFTGNEKRYLTATVDWFRIPANLGRYKADIYNV